jgi:hypothetical protein
MTSTAVKKKVKMEAHVCSFIEWIPASFTDLAFHKSNLKLAAAKRIGNIELWNYNGSRWCLEKVSYFFESKANFLYTI